MDQLAHLPLMLHGGVGAWDEYLVLLLAPLVIGGVLWVTRRRDEPVPASEADEVPQSVDSSGPVAPRG